MIIALSADLVASMGKYDFVVEQVMEVPSWIRVFYGGSQLRSHIKPDRDLTVTVEI